MSGATATVEVLTAEVQVLMVGSRQVTLSVYRQLDSVTPWLIEPFGRVNDSKDPVYSLAVVGRGAGGELTRAFLPVHEGEPYLWSKHEVKFDRANRPPMDAKGWVYMTDHQTLYEDDLRHGARMEYIERWKTLPLIVLAGLR